MVPPCSDRISRVPPYSNPSKVLPLRAYHPLWRDFPFSLHYSLKGIGLIRVRSPLLTESRLISFPPATEMFVESSLKYHSDRFELLTSVRNPDQGQCLVGSLTGAVAS